MGLLPIVLSLILSLSICRGQVYSYKTGSNYPSEVNSASCKRGYFKETFVCDPDEVLGDHTEASQLGEVIKKIANETKCPCSAYRCSKDPSGYKIAIAIVKSLTKYDPNNNNFGYDQYDQRVSQSLQSSKNLNDAQKFAQNIKLTWKQGRCEEDIIIFYSHKDKVVYTATGEVAGRKLTQQLIQDISLNARVNGFTNSAFDGLFSILNDYRAVLLNGYKQQRSAKNVDGQRPSSSSFLSASPVILLVSSAAFLKASFAF